MGLTKTTLNNLNEEDLRELLKIKKQKKEMQEKEKLIEELLKGTEESLPQQKESLELGELSELPPQPPKDHGTKEMVHKRVAALEVVKVLHKLKIYSLTSIAGFFLSFAGGIAGKWGYGIVLLALGAGTYFFYSANKELNYLKQKYNLEGTF